MTDVLVLSNQSDYSLDRVVSAAAFRVPPRPDYARVTD